MSRETKHLKSYKCLTCEQKLLLHYKHLKCVYCISQYQEYELEPVELRKLNVEGV